MAWDQRQRDIRKFPFHHMEIRATDAADVNLDEDLPRIWDRYRSLVKPQRTRGNVIGLVEDHRFHRMSVVWKPKGLKMRGFEGEKPERSRSPLCLSFRTSDFPMLYGFFALMHSMSR